MLEITCLTKNDKTFLSEAVAREINHIELDEDSQMKGRLERLGEMLREILIVDECPQTEYQMRKEMAELGW